MKHRRHHAKRPCKPVAKPVAKDVAKPAERTLTEREKVERMVDEMTPAQIKNAIWDLWHENHFYQKKFAPVLNRGCVVIAVTVKKNRDIVDTFRIEDWRDSVRSLNMLTRIKDNLDVGLKARATKYAESEGIKE